VPEGDTIFRAAATLHRALAGSIVSGFETQFPALARTEEDDSVVGRTVDFASARGKWLQIGFSGDLILLTHMLMSGSWHIYRPGEPWSKSRYHMRIAIATPSIVAVAFNVPVAEFHTARSLEHRQGFSQLGPDVMASDFDQAAAVSRLESYPELEIGVALLTQSLIAGVGNMFKSEVCFQAGVNPFTRIGSLSRDQLEAVVCTARKLMIANATARSITFENRLWVYRRNNELCRKCGEPIQSRKQGVDARTSFWCPVCQRITSSGPV
jgi:endonuclease VIII